MVSGMNLIKICRLTSTLVCEACINGKKHKVAFAKDVERQTNEAFRNCIFMCLWYHENYIRGRYKEFSDFQGRCAYIC